MKIKNFSKIMIKVKCCKKLDKLGNKANKLHKIIQFTIKKQKKLLLVIIIVI